MEQINLNWDASLKLTCITLQSSSLLFLSCKIRLLSLTVAFYLNDGRLSVLPWHRSQCWAGWHHRRWRHQERRHLWRPWSSPWRPAGRWGRSWPRCPASPCCVSWHWNMIIIILTMIIITTMITITCWPRRGLW